MPAGIYKQACRPTDDPRAVSQINRAKSLIYGFLYPFIKFT